VPLVQGATYRQKMAVWEAERGEICAALEIAEAFHGFRPDRLAYCDSVEYEPDEHVYLVIDGAGLVEDRRDLTEERLPTLVERGRATITDRRITFLGPSQSREWRFEALWYYRHLAAAPMTVLQPHGGPTAGLLYDRDSARGIEVRLATAIARHNGTAELLRECIVSDLARHDADRP
jgi:hypothetical protein